MSNAVGDVVSGSDPVLTEVTVAPSQIALKVGETATFEVTAKYDDGSSKVVTSSGNYTADNESVISVTSAGVTAISSGLSGFIVSYYGVRSESVTVTVKSASVTVAVKSASAANNGGNMLIQRNKPASATIDKSFFETVKYTSDSDQVIESGTVFNMSPDGVVAIGMVEANAPFVATVDMQVYEGDNFLPLLASGKVAIKNVDFAVKNYLRNYGIIAVDVTKLTEE